MTLEQQSIEVAGEEPRRRPSGPGALVIAGVIGACALGVGLGLWARPVELADASAPAVVAAAPRPAALQIVIDEAPAPLGQPLEVLPDTLAAAHLAPPAPEPVAPRRPASGLVKVDAPIAAAPMIVPAVAKAPPEPKPAAARREAPAEAEVDAGQARAASAKARRAAEVAALRMAKAEKARSEKAKSQAAKAEKAKLKKAEAARLAKVEKAKAEKAKAARLAKAEARRRAVAAKPAPKRLAAAVKPAKPTPGKAKAEPQRVAAKRKPVVVAKAGAQAEGSKVRKAQAPVRVQAARAAAPPAPKRAVTPRGEGPMRVARANPCGAYDPGEAVVCADPRLGARERQLQQAYRNAEAAGVPTSALRRQQARWQQARAAAAREAPWAVEDVYVARISELNDLTRDAREN